MLSEKLNKRPTSSKGKIHKSLVDLGGFYFNISKK